MAEYKNQHYVPKYLLRGWTDNERVPVYNLDNKEEYPQTSISNLCSEDYFYGGPEMEKSMDGLESLHSDVITKIRDERAFNRLSDMEIRYFCVFVLLQTLFGRLAELAEYIDSDTVHETVDRCPSKVQ